MNKDKTILFVDDDKMFIKTTKVILESSGYNVVEAYDGQQAISMAKKHSPDLILLDINIPKKDGLEVCKKLRKSSHSSETIIIMLTGYESIEDQVTGIEAGADDYITKSTDTRLLYSKIKAFFRKQELEEDESDDIEIDPKSRNVSVKGEEIKLRPKEFDLLYFMKRNKGKVLNKDKIKINVWGDCYLSDHTVEQTLSSLKKKLGDIADIIKTVHGIGYKYQDIEDVSKE
ncbi:MAG: response regulator transcription factor [Atribacterota bacterium]